MASLREELAVRVSGEDNLSPQLDKLESRLIRFVGAVGAGIAAIKIGSAPIKTAADFEQEMANVAKTTDFSARQLRSLQNDLLGLSTQINVSAVDLAKIAAAAGQQGLAGQGVAGVTQFTESVARMASVLDVTAEQAGTDIGKILNIFRIPLRDVENAISVFNEVSNKSTASGEELLDVVKRIGDASGLLRLDQVSGLGATGLDLGLSPEVVGTSFNKIFTSLQQKAKDFGRLMNISATDWTKLLADDGIEAFKKVLESIRKLNVIDQQNTIVKLFGGGRIGSLVNKLVQDTTNSVLDKNLKAAEEGTTGLSAIKEQATVLNTFKSQATLTLNSLIKTSIESSDKIIGDLTKYVIQLREAVESPSFKNFVDTLFSGMSKVVGAIANAVTWVASLNVNWENFLGVIKVFLGLKVAELFAGIAAKASNLGASLQTISKFGASVSTVLSSITGKTKEVDAAQQQQAVNAAKAQTAQLLGYKDLFAAIQRNRAAREEAARTELDAIAKTTAAQKAQADAAQAGAAVRANTKYTAAQSNNLSAARDRVTAAQQAAAQAAADIESRRQAAITNSQAQFATRSAAIEQEYQTKRQAIAATGTQVGLKAARAERAALLQAEEERLARSLAQIDRYWARRATQAAVGAKAAIEAEQAAYMVAQGRFDAAVTNLNKAKGVEVGAASGAASAAAAAAASTTAASAAAKASAALTGQGSVLGRVAALWSGFTLVLRSATGIFSAVATGLGRLVGAFIPIIGWAVTIYSIGDAFGLWDKLGPVFNRLTDSLGLTSAATRRQAIESAAAARAQKEEQSVVENLTEKYRELTKAKDPGQVAKTANDLAAATGNAATTGQRTESLQSLVAALQGGARVVQDNAKDIANSVGNSVEQISASIASAQAQLLNLTKQSEIEQSTAKNQQEKEAIQARYNARIQATVGVINELNRVLDQNKGKLNAASSSAEADVRNYQALADAAGTLFTPESAKLAEEFGRKLAYNNDQIALLEKQAKDISANEANSDARRAAIDDRGTQIREIQRQNNEVTAALRKQIEETAQGASDAVKKSLTDLLPIISSLNTQGLEALLNSLKQAKKLSGENAGFGAAPAPSGTDTFSPKDNGESLARRTARAKIKLAEAENEALRNLQEEGNNQVEAANEEAYKRGLKSIEAYYAARQRLQLQSIDFEIARRQQDIAAVKFEAAGPNIDSAQKIAFQADITKFQGEIDVLQKRKDTIRQATDRDLLRSQQEFFNSIRSTTNQLQDVGLLPSDVVTRTQGQFDELAEAAREKLNTLKSNGQSGLADALLGSFKAEAVTSALKPVQDRTSAINEQFSITKERLSAMNQQGNLTAQELETGLNAAIQNTITKLQEQIAEQEKALGQLKGYEGTTAYANLANQIEQAKNGIISLRNEMNQTAQSLNQGLSSTLTDTLSNFQATFSGIKDAATNLLTGIAQNIRNAIGKNLSDSLLKSVGSLGGSGGFGGAVSGFLGLGGDTAPTGSSTNPFYVVQASSGGDAASALEKLAGYSSDTADGVKQLPNVFSGLFGNVGGIVGTGITLLSGLLTTTSTAEVATTTATAVTTEVALSTGFLSVVSAIFASTAAIVSAVAASGAASGIAGVAHTGGILGRSSLETRAVNPSLFRNAVRFHSGGKITGAGMSGLRAGEVPIIAMKGEEVLTANDPRHQDNIGAAGQAGGGTSGIVNVWVVSQDQQQSVGPNDVVVAVADNIQRGGSIKKLIQQVAMGR